MKIFLIGDSISIQYGQYLQPMLAARSIELIRKEGIDEALVNLDIPTGANGGDSRQLTTYLRSLIGSGTPIKADILLVNCGLHDIKTDPVTGAKQQTLEQYKENLAALPEIAAALGMKLIWMRTTPVDDDTHNSRQKSFHRHAADLVVYQQAADAIMEQAGVPVIDLFTPTASLGAPAEIFIDHVHFQTQVRMTQAGYIAGCLAVILRVKEIVR